MPSRNVKKGEFGIRPLSFGAGTDISTATSYTIELTDPDGNISLQAATLGVVDLSGDTQYGKSAVFLANQYVDMEIPEGLFDKEGRWAYKLLAPTASGNIPGDCGSFDVVC